MNQIYKKIKEYRKRLGLSQKDLSLKLGIGRTQVGRWENPKITPHKSTIYFLKMEGII